VAKQRLRFEERDKGGIPLAEVAAVHRQFRAAISLPGNLGDGFLCAHNPVYRYIRRACLASGFSFTRKNTERYYAFPLMSLDEVIDKRKIPYRNNFVWLEALEKRSPGKFTLTELKRSELQFNYLFHESAHCIAHSLFFSRTRFSHLPKHADSLLQILLGESFANTVEALSAVFAEGEIGSYFLDGNCHFRSSAREVRVIRRCGRIFGFEKTALVLLGSFLYANYLWNKLGRAELARILSFAGLEGTSNRKLVLSLARIGTELSEQFRTTTTQLHLMKLGYPANLQPLMRGDPLLRLRKKGKILAKTRELARIATEGLRL
jgi:hypothetical protein